MMSALNILYSLACAILLLALHRVLRLVRERAKLSRTIPQLEGGGVLGWFPDFFRPDKHRVVAAWSRRYDGIFFYRMLAHHVRRPLHVIGCAMRNADSLVWFAQSQRMKGFTQGVVVTDPHIASEVLLNRPGIQKSDVVKALDLVLSGSGHSGLLTASTNAHWQAVRKAVAPAFSTASIRCRSLVTSASR